SAPSVPAGLPDRRRRTRSRRSADPEASAADPDQPDERAQAIRPRHRSAALPPHGPVTRPQGRPLPPRPPRLHLPPPPPPHPAAPVASGSLLAGLRILSSQVGGQLPGFLADPVAQGLVAFALGEDHTVVAH